MDIGSEAFWITVMGAGTGVLGLLLWYIKSVCMTSRCSDIKLCCGLLAVKNNPVTEQGLDNILIHEGAPPEVNITRKNAS